MRNLEVNDSQKCGVTIYSGENEKAELKDILQIIGESGIRSKWKVSSTEALGKAAVNFHKSLTKEKLQRVRNFIKSLETSIKRLTEILKQFDEMRNHAGL